MVNMLLRLEGLLVFGIFLFMYFAIEAPWILFVGTFLTPDLSIFAYLVNKKVGAIVYNILHNYVFALGLLFVGGVASNRGAVLLGMIFIAHIGMDRFLGFGLKYDSGFKDTHVQKV